MQFNKNPLQKRFDFFHHQRNGTVVSMRHRRALEFGCQRNECSLAYAFCRHSEAYGVLFQA